MTDKERLEGIIQMQYDGYTIWDMSEDDLVWLIEQAERVQELEQQNKRYKQALEFYADEETYETKFATYTDEIYDPFPLIELDDYADHINWLINRVEELEQQNERYREAL